MSDYAKIQKSLDTWEQGLPRDHVWSSFALKGYKTEGQDLVSYNCGFYWMSLTDGSGLPRRDHGDPALQYRYPQGVSSLVSGIQVSPRIQTNFCQHDIP